MKRILAISVAFLGVVLLRPANAAVTDASVSLDAASDSETQTQHLEMDPLTVSVPSGESLSMTVISFQAQVSPGQQVELWLNDEGSVLPWKRNPVDRSLRKGLWIVDERTGTLVRFDLTRLARAAVRDNEPLPGLYFRLSPDDDGNDQDLSAAETAQSKVTYRFYRE